MSRKSGYRFSEKDMRKRKNRGTKDAWSTMAKFETTTGRYVYLEIQGIEYRVYFEEAGQGIPLVCQHTAGSDGQQWRQFLNDEDITATYRVIVPDLPYHGKSQPPEAVQWWSQEYRLTKAFFVEFHL